MKKFFFTAYVIAAITLVPAVIFGYLSNHADSNKPATEMASDVNNGHESSTILQVVKIF
jgi:hypothetical protein